MVGSLELDECSILRGVLFMNQTSIPLYSIINNDFLQTIEAPFEDLNTAMLYLR